MIIMSPLSFKEAVIAQFQTDIDRYTSIMRENRTPYPHPMILLYPQDGACIRLMIDKVSLLDTIHSDLFASMMLETTPVGVGYWFHLTDPTHPPKIVNARRIYHNHLLTLLYTKFVPDDVTTYRVYDVIYSDPTDPSESVYNDDGKATDPHFAVTNLTGTGAGIPILESYLVNPFLYYK